MITPKDNHRVITRMKSPITRIYDTASFHEDYVPESNRDASRKEEVKESTNK